MEHPSDQLLRSLEHEPVGPLSSTPLEPIPEEEPVVDQTIGADRRGEPIDTAPVSDMQIDRESPSTSSADTSSTSSSSTPRGTQVRRPASAPATNPRNTRQRSVSSVPEPDREPTPRVPSHPREDERTLAEAAGAGNQAARNNASGASTPRSNPNASDYVPQGGWIRAQERSRSSPYGGVAESYYYQIPEDELNWEAIPEDSYLPAKECWIAWHDEKQQLWVGVQATDASSVNYRDLSPSEDRKSTRLNSSHSSVSRMPSSA